MLEKPKTQKLKHKIPKTNNGITLIALVITVIVMLILVAVTISMAVNGGLFDYAGKALGDTKNAISEEQRLANGAIKVDGVWYDSIDDYLKGKPSENQGEGDTGGEDEEEGPVKITLSIAGTKVETVPVPTGFTHTEGTIDTGYVITDQVDAEGNSIGNEFVWVPVDKNQKITLKVESEKEIQELKLYDPYGDAILTVADGEIEKNYNNTDIAPTVNGMYIAVATTEDGITQETLTVKSLYAFDTANDWYSSEEYAKIEGYNTIEDNFLDFLSRAGMTSIEEGLQYLEAPTVEVALTKVESLIGGNDYEDLEDYSESVNENGGFYIGRYEAGTTTPRPTDWESELSELTVEEIITANGKPISKEGAYPYNCVTFNQAKGLAERMYESNDSYTVSLLTGSAWDRTLGWIQETKSKSVKAIRYDSSSWGNYDYVEFNIIKGQYKEYQDSTFSPVSGTYTKPAESDILLTTGATIRNRVKNIFDLAGNVAEWTNEAYPQNSHVYRGWGFDASTTPLRVSDRIVGDGDSPNFPYRPSSRI